MFFKKAKPVPAGTTPEMRSLLQRLTFRSEAPVRIVAFIAARPREGTSTIARDYATAVALETTQKVLLIDAGKLHAERFKLHGIDPKKGIVEAVSAGHSPIDAAHHIAPGISLARWNGRDDARNLAGRLARDSDLWEALLQEFDTIVIDAPPLQSSFDGIVLASRADAVAMVVEAEITRQPVIENLRDTLQAAGARIAGMVMNKRRFYIPARVYKRL